MSLEKNSDDRFVGSVTKTPFYGIIKFTPALCCAGNTLGCCVDVSVGGVKGTLTLPSLPELNLNEDGRLNKPLLGPSQARTWKQGEELIYWGIPHSSDGESVVEQALFEFSLDSENFDSVSECIHSGIGQWIDLFEKYVILLSTQGKCSRVTSNNPRSNQIQLLHHDDSTRRLKHKSYPQSFTVNVVRGDELQREQFEEISRMSSLLLPPRLEYLLLIEAYTARKNQDYRKAIIEAANALEVSLTNRISEEFKNQKIAFGDKLLKKFRMLGGRFELARILNIFLPSKDYEKLVIEPRNDVIHKAGFPNEKIACQVISEVEEVLRLFSPIIHETSPLPTV